jgi:uncharacterized membrane protein YagU involved in acid resistance
MKQIDVSRAVLGGFVGTLLMTAMLYLAPLGGAPKMDIAALLGSLFGHGIPAVMSAWWWTGMIWHFVNGTIIFSLIYSSLIYGWMPGENWVRGMIWGIILWIGMEIILMPVTGNGVFSDHATYPVMRVLDNLILHAIYGAVLGALAGRQAEHPHQVTHAA